MTTLNYDPISAVSFRLGLPGGEDYMAGEKAHIVEQFGAEAYEAMEGAVLNNDVEAALRFAAVITPGTAYETKRIGMWIEVHHVDPDSVGHSKMRTRHEAVAIVSAVGRVRVNALSRARQAAAVEQAAATAAAGGMEILLSNIGNQDFRQDPDKPLPGTVSGNWKPVASWDEASETARQYIVENDLGGGNWSGGEVRNAATKEMLGQISYNGRAWPVEPGAAPRF